MADQVSPSQFAPKPNGAPTNGTPAPPTPAPDPISEAKKFRDEGAALRDAAEKRSRVHAIEARKFADEKKGIGAKLTEHGQFQKRLAEIDKKIANAKLDPEPFLREYLGDDYYDRVISLKLNGGAPTAGTVTAAVEAVTEKFEKRLADEREAMLRQQRESEDARVAEELKHYTSQAAEFAKLNAKEYPLVMRNFGGNEQAVANSVMAYIRSEFDKTQKSPTFKEALEKFEEHYVGIAEAAAGVDKYKEKLTGKLKPANTSPVGGVPQGGSRSGSERRTVSNDLTATTPGQRRQPTNDDERRERAFAAYEAARTK